MAPAPVTPQCPPVDVTPGLLPAGVEFDAVVAELAEDGVAAPAAVQGKIAPEVARAREQGLDLSVVVVEAPANHVQLRYLATTAADGLRCDAEAAGEAREVTVLALSSGDVAAISDSVPRARLEKVEIETRTMNNPELQTKMLVDQTVGPSSMWMLPVGVISMLILVAVVIVTVAFRRRSIRAD